MHFMALIFLFLMQLSPSGFSETRPVTFAVSTPVENLDPTEAEDFATVRVLLNIGTALLRYDKNLKTQPGLAKEWDISKDKKTITFKLGKHVWSDGKPIVAEDFVFGIKRLFVPEIKAKIAAPFKDILKSVESPSTDTVVVRLTKPASYALSLFALPFCFPQRPDANYEKISSGPFLISEFKKGSRISLIPNPRFHQPAERPVTLITIRETTTAVQLYKKKEVDIVERLPAPNYQEFAEKSDLQKIPTLAVFYLGFGTEKTILSNPRLRQALAAAIDREKIFKLIQPPQKLTSSFIPSPLEGSHESHAIPFDPKLAKRLWTDNKGPQKLDFYYDGQEKNRLIGQFIQAQLKSTLNIDVSLKEKEWRAYLQLLSSETLPFWRLAWLAAFPDPSSHLGVFTKLNPNNHGHFTNETYDSLIDTIATTESGPKRRALIGKAQKILLVDEVAIIPLFQYVEYYLVRPDLKGYELSPMGLVYLDRF